MSDRRRFRIVGQPSLSIIAWRATREEAQEVIDGIRGFNPDMPEDELTIWDAEDEDPHDDSGSGGY